MASYSPKLIDKKYNNWVKAQLAVLFTKEGVEPFVCNEIQKFQLKCLHDICYYNGLLSGTCCSSCCTENVVYCPTDNICKVKRGKCTYHRNVATRYSSSGCPNRICHNFKTEIQNAHRYNGPSYKNSDATQWCSNYWEVAKCFMPPDGYNEKASASETDFNGIINVILNHKDFQGKIHENLNNKINIFEEARVIGRNMRHSSKLEEEDSDLQNKFKLLLQLLSDPVHLATDTHAQNAIHKLIQLENDTLVIGKDDIMKVLNDVAIAIQDKMKAGLDERYDKINLDMIRKKQEDLLTLQYKTAEGMTQIQDTADASVKRLNDEREKATVTIHEQGDKVRTDLAELGETLQRKLETASKTDKKEQLYIDTKLNVQNYCRNKYYGRGNMNFNKKTFQVSIGTINVNLTPDKRQQVLPKPGIGREDRSDEGNIRERPDRSDEEPLPIKGIEKEDRRDARNRREGPDKPDRELLSKNGNTVYVHGYGVNEELLRKAFHNIGNIVNISMEKERNSAFVTFDTMDRADIAIQQVDGAMIDNVLLHVTKARRKPLVDSTRQDPSSTSDASVASNNSQIGSFKDDKDVEA